MRFDVGLVCLMLLVGAAAMGCTDQPDDAPEAGADTTAVSFDGPIGVQLYSVRNELEEDLRGTLAAVRNAGFTDVETYSLHGMTAPEYRALLDSVGLSVSASHMPYERVVNETAAVAEEAAALGAEWVVVPWIPHEEPFSAEDMERAIADFNTAAQALQQQGLKFAYHAHGYEFHEAEGGGTLFDTFLAETDPELVKVEMDVYWVVWPGQDPVAMLQAHPDRYRLLHIKDLRSDITEGDLTGHAPLDYQVPIGDGRIDWPSILSAAEEAGVEHYYIEYEHTEPLTALEQSLEYLRSL